jgi:phosphoenolpyruvate carboxykinase (ATP)
MCVMREIGPAVSSHGLDKLGFRNLSSEHWNLTPEMLVEEALRRQEGALAQGGALVTHTGHHTGRSANDKFVVKEPSSESDIWWGSVNRPFEPERFDALHRHMLDHLSGRDVYVRDCYAGANPKYRLQVRVITESAWHNLFACNMFIAPKPEDLRSFRPEFTVIQAPSCHAIPARHGTNSETFILVNFAKRLVLIGGSSYAGEIKKSVFSILNFLLPPQGILPMHCSANVGPKGDAAIFFGLSGTGKTTLSADAARTLIGDDEHGWGEDGVFNFEGGCYAKVIKLNREAEPEIHATTRAFGTILENVIMDMDTRALDLDDARLTENTRASYPLSRIPNASATGMAGHPRNIVMLTCDAFGVMPPISKLAPEQAMYHFLSGYTAKVAGTEKGLKEPTATFSTCFGAPFMPRHPAVYAKLLGDKMARHGAHCWLVNTGWSGGGYGEGHRMPIAHTRALLAAALEGKLADASFRPDPNFGMLVPEACPGVPKDVLTPRATWRDPAKYDARAREIRGRFESNFRQFESQVDDKVRAAAIRAAA